MGTREWDPEETGNPGEYKINIPAQYMDQDFIHINLAQHFKSPMVEPTLFLIHDQKVNLKNCSVGMTIQRERRMHSLVKIDCAITIREAEDLGIDEMLRPIIYLEYPEGKYTFEVINCLHGRLDNTRISYEFTARLIRKEPHGE